MAAAGLAFGIIPLPLDGDSSERMTWAPQAGPQHSFVECPLPEILFGGARGGGKALSVGTIVPVPLETNSSGYKTMGELKAGDIVFSSSGTPTVIEYVSEIKEALWSYEVEFDTGEVIRADGEHLWHTMTKTDRVGVMRADASWRARRRAKRPSRAKADASRPFSPHLEAWNKREQQTKPEPTGGVKTTDEIRETLAVQNGREFNHSIAVTKPLELPERSLPIDPYLLGVWLGDGRASTGSIGMALTDYDAIAMFLPAPVWSSLDKRPAPLQPFLAFRIPNLTRGLQSLGLIRNKHIPVEYLRCSREQRIALLQGLLDTDGHCNGRGQIEIGLSDKSLVEQLHDLISGLGIKATMRKKPTRLNGKVCKPSFVLKFMASFPAFRLQRKLDRQKMGGFRSTVMNRYIVDVRRIAPCLMRCIKVADPSGMYLVGRTMIATHNSDAILGKYLLKSWKYGAAFNAVFMRKEMPQADDLIDRAKQLYLDVGAKWREQAREFIMPRGGRIRFRPLENVTDAQKFQGQNLSDIAIEESGNYADPAPIDMMFGALRSRSGVPVQLVLTANPGGPGQHWIKHRYIDPAPMGMKVLERRLPNGAIHKYIYIPSRVQDNRVLLANDPQYVNRLYLVGSSALVRAWLEGDWSVVAGAFFPEFSIDKHVVAPLELPMYWHRFRSFDWGSARPFSVGWWAVSDGELPRFPRGALIKYREWYGAQRDGSGETVPNTGLRLTAEEVADGILQREEDDLPGRKVMGGVADPSIFSADGGPSIADRMGVRRVFWREADNTRVSRMGAMGGWDQLRARLKGDGEKPAIYFFSTCKDTIRTLPALQHDSGRPEDCDSSSEDHACDEVRYACMSRPYTAPLPPEMEPERDRYARRWRPRIVQGGRSGWAA